MNIQYIPDIRYTALGDSVGFGLGASCFQGYVCMLGRYLRNMSPNISICNLSKIMAGSEDLLHQARYNPRVRYIISSSSFLTICIGGNNLLRATRSRYTHIDENKARYEIFQFAREFDAILQEIRNGIYFGGPIYVMTLYNPARYDDPRYQIFNHYILMLNSIIANEVLRSNYDYTVVDAYSHFESNLQKNWTHFYDPIRNIHPNNEGHEQLFNLHRIVLGI